MTSVVQKKLNFTAKVMETFAQVQKSSSIHQTHIFQLLKYEQDDFQLFMYSFEQAYLKIFQSFHSKANKKIPSKFENLAQSFFEAALSKKYQQQYRSEESKKIYQVFNSFLVLCSQGIYSTIMNIRIMCCRLVFLLVKQIPPKKMEIYLKEQVQQALINATLHIIRTKVSTYRQLGIKLASLLLHFNAEKCHEIQKQMFKILAVQDNQQIRKLVITNLSITKGNLEDVLTRLRDKNPQIRSIVAKKLQNQRFKLEDMTISNIYKLLYDGYGSKQQSVKKQCLRYFSMYFIQSQHQQMVDQNINRHQQFINLFRPDLLLLNPHLYHLFDQLIFDLLQQLQVMMKQYIRKSCEIARNGNLTYQLIWLKNSVNSKSRQISRTYQQYGPAGVELSKILLQLGQKNQAFAIFQLLQLFGRQKMPDEIGRNKMFDALKTLLIQLKFYNIQPNYTNFKDSDICHMMSSEEINRKKLMLSFYDMPIISNSLDLIFQIGQTMKSLRPEHYEIQMKQVMSQWHNPEQNTKSKDKQIIQQNITKLEVKKQANQNVIKRLRDQLKQVQCLMEQDAEKTRKVLMCISRLRYNCDLEIFMSIIKQQLSKQDKANGLLLLGLYCLQNVDKVAIFWNIFWQYISSSSIEGYNKNHLLVSLKVIIDFIVKFNCLSSSFHPQNVQQFNADMFMAEMVKLMLHEDPDIRILAIQSQCRLLYHERVDKQNQSTYFLYLILLWLQTSTQVISAKSVHTVSIFIKSYIEKGNNYSLKLSYIFCLFFKILIQFQQQKKGINKQLITYNLSMEQFIKKTLFTVMTIFKYQKQSRNVIWVYNPQDSQIGPQQFLVLYLIKDDKIMPFLGRTLAQCDFFQFCGLQTLIFVKKAIQKAGSSKSWKGITQQTIRKLEEDIQRQISLKKTQIFNDHTVELMQKQEMQKMTLLQQQAKYIHKNLEEKNLFIRRVSDDSDQQSSSKESSVSSDELQQQDIQQNKQQIQEYVDSESKEQQVRKRKKIQVMSLSQQDQQNEKSEEDKPKQNQKKDTKKKKQMPVALLRNLRKRK